MIGLIYQNYILLETNLSYVPRSSSLKGKDVNEILFFRPGVKDGEYPLKVSGISLEQKLFCYQINVSVTRHYCSKISRKC